MFSPKTLIAVAIILTSPAVALADFDMKAGPIMNQGQADTLCPQACKLTFNGAWVTKVAGQMSICSGTNTVNGTSFTIMDAKGGLNAGPIFSNAEAPTKCAAAFAGTKWNGQWSTTKPGEMSVCGCTGTAQPWTPNIEQP
ncbi:mannan-binding lectin [Ancylobacter sp. SL191]|uniref:mannan-binding lectin n=1 Tax=Ancylobacter sp. SL191 TaxID=2995166 RepID=UPI002271D6C7|nr:mannan-binding lectin [Ancylobacter sp. SL191]WAC28033.1 mannan-binding lectin [Ancylobacter sp. SL191]